MKLTRLLLAAALALAPSLTYAQVTPPSPSFHPDIRLLATLTATPAYTNATTSYTDVAGTSYSLPATSRDYSTQYIRACFWADATKATATTGTIQVYANGAGIAASRRTITSGAGNGDISECFTVARADATAQTLKLQAVSGDTNTFTINNMQVEWYVVQNGRM